MNTFIFALITTTLLSSANVDSAQKLTFKNPVICHVGSMNFKMNVLT